MILWIVLVCLVLAISLCLALLSMRDYQQIPSSKMGYGLYLIRQLDFLGRDILASIHEDLLKKDLILSFERLIKGNKAALVVMGPKSILEKFNQTLDLLELEDYTQINLEYVSAWEEGVKKGEVKKDHILNKLPKLLDSEQFWWQLTLLPKKDGNFNAQIRAVLVSEDPARRKELTRAIQNISADSVFKLPKAFSNERLIDFYKKRSLNHGPSNKSEKSSDLSLDGVLNLLKL